MAGDSAGVPAEPTKKRGRPKEPKSHDAKLKEPKSHDAKTQETKKRKTKQDSKPKPPAKVNVDKQCGVPLTDQDGELVGGLCARSLTCKTHSMGAKRAVKGRSQPYDTLLSMYQQRNHLKAAAANALQQNKKAADAEADANAEAGGPPLSDADEVAEVLRGAAQSKPIPLDRMVLTPTQLRTGYINIREFLYKSTSVPPPPPVNGGPPLAAIMASTDAVLGRCVLYNPATEAQSVRPSQIYANSRMHKIMMERYQERAKKQ